MNQARGRDTVSSPFQVLEVTVFLTEMGLLAWEDVAASVFAFTAMLREDGVPTHFMNEVVSSSKYEPFVRRRLISVCISYFWSCSEFGLPRFAAA